MVSKHFGDMCEMCHKHPQRYGHEAEGDSCESCLANAVDLRECGRCGETRYCVRTSLSTHNCNLISPLQYKSKVCQTANWLEHRIVCRDNTKTTNYDNVLAIWAKKHSSPILRASLSSFHLQEFPQRLCKSFCSGKCQGFH